MVRPLDHLVIGVPDLAAAGALFEALGFQVGGVNRHPWGTHNRIVQFADETFLELITVGESEKIPEHGDGFFSFGAFVRDALARRPGLSMLVLKSSDASTDAAAFRAAGMGDFEPFDFSRKGRGPKGNQVEVAFSLAFAADPALPEAAFFTCQQHFPRNFWSDAAQGHPNGATGIARVTLVAENPSDHHIFLAAFTGNREMRATSFGIEIEVGNAVIEVTSPQGFAFRYGEIAPAAVTPVFGGIEITASHLRLVSEAALPEMLDYRGGMTLPSRHFGTTLRFVEG